MAQAIDILQNYGLSVKETDTKGKGLFAEKAIKEGDVILSEDPLVASQFSWNKAYNYTACEYCMKSMETAQNMARRLTNKYDLQLPYIDECCEILKQKNNFVRCPRCQERYCCEECFEKADQKYHRSLCLGNEHKNNNHPLLRLEEAWKKIHYPPETATVMLILKMLAMIAQSKYPDELSREFTQFYSNIQDHSQRMAHKLLGDLFKEQLVMLHTILQEVISCMGISKEVKTVDDLKSMLGLIGMNGQGVGTRYCKAAEILNKCSLSAYVHNIDAMSLSDEEREKVDQHIDSIYDEIADEAGQFLNCEGSGLYSVQSRCNHSCVPNAEVTFPNNNSTLVLIALNDIQQGEEICICYLDECQRSRSRHSRRKYLRENYLFECTCTRCELDDGEISETSSDDDDEMDEEDK